MPGIRAWFSDSDLQSANNRISSKSSEHRVSRSDDSGYSNEVSTTTENKYTNSGEIWKSIGPFYEALMADNLLTEANTYFERESSPESVCESYEPLEFSIQATSESSSLESFRPDITDVNNEPNDSCEELPTSIEETITDFERWLSEKEDFLNAVVDMIDVLSQPNLNDLFAIHMRHQAEIKCYGKIASSLKRKATEMSSHNITRFDLRQFCRKCTQLRVKWKQLFLKSLELQCIIEHKLSRSHELQPDENALQLYEQSPPDNNRLICNTESMPLVTTKSIHRRRCISLDDDFVNCQNSPDNYKQRESKLRYRTVRLSIPVPLSAATDHDGSEEESDRSDDCIMNENRKRLIKMWKNMEIRSSQSLVDRSIIDSTHESQCNSSVTSETEYSVEEPRLSCQSDSAHSVMLRRRCIRLEQKLHQDCWNNVHVLKSHGPVIHEFQHASSFQRQDVSNELINIERMLDDVQSLLKTFENDISSDCLGEKNISSLRIGIQVQIENLKTMEEHVADVLSHRIAQNLSNRQRNEERLKHIEIREKLLRQWCYDLLTSLNIITNQREFSCGACTLENVPKGTGDVFCSTNEQRKLHYTKLLCKNPEESTVYDSGGDVFSLVDKYSTRHAGNNEAVQCDAERKSSNSSVRNWCVILFICLMPLIVYFISGYLRRDCSGIYYSGWLYDFLHPVYVPIC